MRSPIAPQRSASGFCGAQCTLHARTPASSSHASRRRRVGSDSIRSSCHLEWPLPTKRCYDRGYVKYGADQAAISVYAAHRPCSDARSGHMEMGWTKGASCARSWNGAPRYATDVARRGRPRLPDDAGGRSPLLARIAKSPPFPQPHVIRLMPIERACRLRRSPSYCRRS